jgi:hypothetical protein
VTAAAQTGLSCSTPLLARVLRPLPRRGQRLASDLAPPVLPSPRHDRLGPRIVHLSRLQASLHVAAHVLAPRCVACAASRASDAPLGHRGLPPSPGACYPALRRLPGPVSHRLERQACSSRTALLRVRCLCRVTTHHEGRVARAPLRDSHGTREAAGLTIFHSVVRPTPIISSPAAFD